MPLSSLRFCDPAILTIDDPEEWEKAYAQTIDRKYAKDSKKWSTKIQGVSEVDPSIYLIPRERGGPSFKDAPLAHNTSDQVHYALVSKGFAMQALSSFSLGPIPGPEGGLCLVNYAFSKQVCIHHIEGGGKINKNRKALWQRSRKPKYQITVLSEDYMLVDDKKVNSEEWLLAHRKEWYPGWKEWRNLVALCSNGNFHWGDLSSVVKYYHEGIFLDFVEWKKECYIRPSLRMMPSTPAYQFLVKVWEEEGHPLGLVHPMALQEGEIIQPITKKYLRELFDSKVEMCCQPYVVAAGLLGMKV